jgi:predicted esterase
MTGRAMSTPKFQGWPYVVHIPEDYRGDEPFPLLIYLSGGPGRAIPAAMNARSTVTRSGYLVLFPQANELWWNERATSTFPALLEEVLGVFNIDTNRIYLVGFSNGGTGAVKFSTLWPHRFAAVVSLMGAGMFPTKSEWPLVANATNVPFLFLHGSKDRVVSVKASIDTVGELRRKGMSAPLKMHIFEERDHDLWLGNDDGKTLEFIQRHRRFPFPRRIKLAIRRMDYARRYWVEVLSKENGVAQVEGEIKDDNSIHLKCSRVKRLRLLLRRELLPHPGPVRIMINGRNVFQDTLTADCELLQRTWSTAGDPYLAYSTELVFEVPR